MLMLADIQISKLFCRHACNRCCTVFCLICYLICIFLAVDLLYGNVYCFLCGTYVYDDELEQISKDEADKAAWIVGCGKRKYFEWRPSDIETALLTMTTKRRKISKDSIVGKALFSSIVSNISRLTWFGLLN